jgi:ABC-type nitrate/sulfonate/bicarbonate transport system substrate-binding protein
MEKEVVNESSGKGWIWIVGAIVVALVIGGYFMFYGGEEYVGEVEKVTMGISATSLLPSLVHIADENGYFLEEGVDMEVKGYPTGKDALVATLNGEIEMGTVADTPIVFNSFKRNDFAVFATILDSAQHAKALARKDRGISSPQDLIGKKIGTTIGTTAHFSMVTFFIINSLDIDDVEIVNMKPKEMIDAIVGGDVDAIFAWEPNIYNAQESLGDNGVLLPSDVGYEQTFNLISKNDFIENNPELLKKILRALVKAEEFAKDNQEESIDIIASRLETNREIIDELWEDYQFRVSLSQTLIVTLEDEGRWYIKSNLTDATSVPNYLDYIYTDALEEVDESKVTIIK